MSRIDVATLTDLAVGVLERVGTSSDNASLVAKALVAAELDGLTSHGISRLDAYTDQVVSGKVDGRAEPAVVYEAAAAVRVDACHGFAFPAIHLGLDAAVPRARAAGSCFLGIAHSHHAGVMGHHVERIAEAGLVGVGFSNSPAAMAPWGGHKAVFGTNPISFAAPRSDNLPMVIDLSLSAVARGKVMVAKQNGEPIPTDWALDSEGAPTTDADAALAGTMMPAGGAKGAALALMVEILAATLTGSSYAFEASSFFNADGPPPDIGQSFLLIDAAALVGSGFGARLELLLDAIAEQPGARIPGERRQQTRAEKMTQGVEIDDALLAQMHRRSMRQSKNASQSVGESR